MAILNLTQHKSTPEQIAQGVIDLDAETHLLIKNLLTFDEIPTSSDLAERAESIAQIAADLAAQEDREDSGGFALYAMIGGAPFFMSALENALLDVGIQPLYAFSVRESVEKVMDDGSVTKTNVFKHAGFVQI